MKPILISLAMFATLYVTVLNGGPQHLIRSGRAVNEGLDLTQHPTLIFLNRGIIDTSSSRLLDTSARDAKLGGSAERPAGQASAVLRIVQFNGAIKPAWVSLIKATGCSIVGYLPNYSYIVFGSSDQIASLAGLERKTSSDATNSEDADRPLVRWMAAFQPLWKIDRAYSKKQLENSTGLTTVQIEMINGRGLATAEAKIASSGAVVSGERSFAGFTVVTATVQVTELIAVANIDEVLYIERAPAPALLDERSDQIAAGNLTADLTEPIGPGYLSWLTSLGLNTPMDFAIEFSDSGLDRGSTSASFLHPDFLDASGHSRVAYINNYVASAGLSANDTRGHGTLVTSIAAGYPNVGINDPDGYQLGTGAAPFATIGASRIFDMMGTVPSLLSLSKVMSAAYADGARVANESWGQAGNQYDIAAQEFDELTRDSRPDQDGNQEMTFVFAAGNEGPGGHVDSPGTAKNVITVGASENYRPDSFDTCNLDGQGALGPDASDNALGILRFSSGGPTFDGRSKPDLVAPGTHIYGARSQDPNYNAAGLCPGFPIYGSATEQHFYVSSSGTSLATPAVSGAAALIRQYFVNKSILPDGAAPSPAMLKAYLVNSTDHLTGPNADDGDLPGQRQGWGLINLSRGFDSTPRILVDETRLLTASGQTYQINGSISDRTKPVRITLAWTDAPGTPVGLPWVNDLDLELTVGGSTIYRGNNFSGAFSVSGGSPDRWNNLECIFIAPDQIPVGADGNFTITVRAANIAGDGVPGNGIDVDQDFALAAYNIAPPIVPAPRIDSVTYSAKVLTISGAFFSSDATVSINGAPVGVQFSFDQASNSLTVRAKPKKLNLVKKSANQIIVVEKGQSSAAYTLQL